MTNPAPHSAPDADELLRAAQQVPHARVAKLKHNGRRYWIKRVEVTPLRFRLQKGNGAVAFRREVARLKAFAAKGVPVPPILAETPDMIVLADVGKPLTRLARRASADEFQHVLSLAAVALAQLHAMGVSHGRPRLRDICWNRAEIRFVDLEAGARLRASRLRQARDLLVFLHSIFQNDPDISAYADSALAAYAGADHGGIVPLARRIARWSRPVAFLAAPLIRGDRRRGKSNSEFVAFADLLHFLS
ncbi:hypothetical protein [Roseinatronobacter sp.]